MEVGKLSNEILEKIIFENIENKRDEVLVGSGIGEDTAIIDFGEEVCVLSTDPITGATKDIGHLAVHISCNDIASSGAEPIAVLLTILAPPNTSEKEIKTIMRDASLASKELNIEIAGGHTEITDAVNKIVLSTTVIGKQKKKEMIETSNIDIGDKVLITKKIGIEGTSILAKELEVDLKGKMTKEEIEYAKSMDKDLSVLKEGLISAKVGVDYMHDITEGGILGAVWEAGEAIGFGIDVYEEEIPIDDVTLKLSKILNIDPYKLISSGSMLIVMKSDKIDILRKKLSKEGISLSIIGEVTEGDVVLKKGDVTTRVDSPESDELYSGLKAFE